MPFLLEQRLSATLIIYMALSLTYLDEIDLAEIISTFATAKSQKEVFE
jgi:hypothetical protein